MFDEKECVVSGIAGRFPMSDNVEEYWYRLMSGRPLYEENNKRWPLGLYGLPSVTARVQDLEKIDASFFDLDGNYNFIDPGIRLDFEVIYEAIWDAGVNPESLRGSRVSVILGAVNDDTHTAFERSTTDGVPRRTVGAIAAAFGFIGPSFDIDTACASSLSGLNEGLIFMKYMMCDALIVVGNAVHLNPTNSLSFKLLKMHSEDGRSKCLDATANGYCRAEAVGAMLIQRRKEAKRIYASILSCVTNTDGYKEDGITYPKSSAQEDVMKRTIAKANIDPLSIKYIESHATGTAVGDPIECRSMLAALRGDNQTPLLIGCLKSNMGHTEASAGLCAIVKICLIFQNGVIPPNINFTQPNPNIEGLQNGRLVPVLRPTQFQEDIVAVNAFGFGGVNASSILKANEKRTDATSFAIVEKYPRLINVCGRTAKQITHTFSWIENNRDKVNNDFLSLLNEVSKITFESKLNYRGYMIIDGNDNILKKVSPHNIKKQPLWYIFSGFGGFWPAMAVELMVFEPFATSIKKSADIVKETGIDLVDVLTNEEFPLSQCLTESFVGTMAIQLALYDTLEFLGLIPDAFIGVSLGELVCAVIDGCLTREIILPLVTKFMRMIEVEKSLDRGLMLAVEGNYENIMAYCPDGAYPATDLKSGAIHLFGGRHDVIIEFQKRLTLANISWRTENTFNYSVHCPQQEISMTNTVIGIDLNNLKIPIKRTKRWLSLSIDEHKSYFDEELIRQILFSTVQLQDLIECIPKNACAVEINCHPILRSIMKMTGKLNFDFIPLIWKASNSNVLNILQAVGQAYNSGKNPEIEKLYPKVSYPVPRETASLSPLFKWDHSQTMFVAKYPYQFYTIDYHIETFDLSDEDYVFLAEHSIDQRILFPATGFIYFIWRRFSLSHGFNELYPYIEFRDTKVVRAIVAKKSDAVSLTATFQKQTGEFCVTSKDDIHVLGSIRLINPFKVEHHGKNEPIGGDLSLDRNSFYKELRVSGYDYGPSFQRVMKMSFDGKHAKLQCSGHIISILDAVMQIFQFAQTPRNFRYPTRCGQMSIDLPKLLKAIEEEKEVDVNYEKETKTLSCEFLILRNSESTFANRHTDGNHRIWYYCFAPLDNHFQIAAEDMVQIESHNNLCASMTRLLRNSNQKTVASDTLNKVQENQLQLPKMLKQALDENQSIVDFAKFIGEQKMNYFPLTKGRTDLIEEPLQICFQEKVSSEIIILEMGSNESSSEKVVKEMCRLFACRCDYKVIKSDLNSASLCKPADIIIYRDTTTGLIFNENLITEKKALQKLVTDAHNLLVNNGFLLLYFREKLTNFENEAIGLEDEKLEMFCNSVTEVINESLFTSIARKTDDLNFTSILLRKNRRNENISVIETTGQGFEWLNDIKGELKDESKQIVLKSKTKEINGVTGLTRCLLEEYGPKRVCCVVDDANVISDEIERKALSLVVVKNNIIGTLAMKTFNKQLVPAKHAIVDMVTKGDLTTFQWFEASHKLWDELTYSERKQKLLLNVHYSALNFRDTLLATNRIPSSCFPVNDLRFGMEYSGVDSSGRRLFGCCSHKAIATTLVLDDDHFYFEVPEEWTLEEASTITVVYASVYYSLIMRAKLINNETVLIHAGSGGVGQAAIRLCLSKSCKIFTSVGSDEKKRKLMQLFPQLNDESFVDSRSVAFEESIMKATNGRGVDIVLNSLSEEKLLASINCVAEGGRFVEIGKYDILEDNKMIIQQRNSTFEVACLAHLFHDAFENKTRSAIAKVTELRDLMSDGIKIGVIKPLNSHVFERNQVEKAFRFMASGKHFGKVVVKIRGENELNNNLEVMAIPKSYFYPSKVYIIVGGLGGMGLQLAYWLSERGAMQIILTSRHGIRDVYQKYMIQLMEKNGTQVFVVVNKLNDYSAAQKLLVDASAIAPIGAIFNLALVLKDMAFETLTPEIMVEVCNAKIMTTELLDKCSRKLCPNLDYFVCFSSIIASLGNAGQSSYAFANSAMEMICKKRKRDGLHALAIQWGLVGDVGIVIEESKSNEKVIRGMKPQRIISCFETLEWFLASNHTVCMSAVQPELSQNNVEVGDFVEKILHILGVSDTLKFDETTIIGDLGVDSLMAVEIRQMLHKDFNVELNSKQIRSLSFQEIRKQVLMALTAK